MPPGKGGPTGVVLSGIQCIMGVGLEEVVCLEIRGVTEGRLHFPRVLNVTIPLNPYHSCLKMWSTA